MILLRQKHAFALFSIFVVVFVSVAQVLANTWMIIAALGCFFLLVLWASLQDMIFPIMLFFLPWAPLLKLRPGTTSMYTIALMVMLAIYMLRVRKKAYVLHIFPVLLLLGLVLVVKALNDYPISNDFATFIICMLLFPILSGELRNRYDFYSLTVFYTLGIALAAISSQYLLVFPTISRYIVVHSFQTVTRLAGYYGDPNFYSVHITSAIAGVMILLTKENKRSRRWVLYAFMLLLLYCGFLAVAKSFALVTICLFLFWILHIMFQRGRISLKLLLLLSIAVGSAFILSTTLFTDLLDMMIYRFTSSSGSLDKLTTGRIELWINYINALESDPLLLWFGQGYTNILVNGRASHSTLLQVIYQLGLLGTVLMVWWGVTYFHSVTNKIRLRPSMLMPITILLIGAIGPWLALDMLFFDDFFLLPLYIGAGIGAVADSEGVAV